MLAACGTSSSETVAAERGAGGAASFPSSESPAVHVRGIWNRANGEWIWQLPFLSRDEGGVPHGCLPIWMEDGRRIVWICPFQEAVYGAITPGSSASTLLDSTRGRYRQAPQGDAFGDLAIWSEVGTRSARVRGWRPYGEGVRTLLDDIPGPDLWRRAGRQAGGRVCGARILFRTRLRVAAVGRGPGPDGRLENHRPGPIVTDQRSGLSEPVKTWGDYIAVVWGLMNYQKPEDSRQLLVARASDWKAQPQSPAGPRGLSGPLDRRASLRRVHRSDGSGVGQVRYDLPLRPGVLRPARRAGRAVPGSIGGAARRSRPRSARGPVHGPRADCLSRLS